MWNDNIAAWVEQMRTTTERQADGALCKKQRDHGSEVEAYCCLGLGSKEFIPGLRISVNRPVGDDEDPHDEDTEAWSEDTEVYFNDVKDLAPIEFRVWLGVLHENETQTAAEEKDVMFDVPEEIGRLYVQGTPEQGGDPERVNYEQITSCLSAATANDSGFTFPQIADMVAYFGLKREVV